MSEATQILNASGQRDAQATAPGCRHKTARRTFRARLNLEELEARLGPASFAVNAQLEVARLDTPGGLAAESPRVVFFEDAVGHFG